MINKKNESCGFRKWQLSSYYPLSKSFAKINPIPVSIAVIEVVIISGLNPDLKLKTNTVTPPTIAEMPALVVFQSFILFNFYGYYFAILYGIL